MRLYLDEDMASRELARALKKAEHEVSTPMEVDLLSESDVLQLTHAIRDDRVCITKNSSDFEQLHALVILCGGSHPGIFTLRSDNDRRRDMKPGQVVHAINNVASVLSSVRNHVICLNEWR
jgi:predicted nuclease of predicted toxin-antitoxin system